MATVGSRSCYRAGSIIWEAGRYPVDGFVRVADLDAAYRSPFSNRCDMMYLNAGLKAGPHMRTVVAHEYMHAVVFSQKSLRRASGGRAVRGRGGLAGRSDGAPRRGPERVFDVEHRLSRQCVLDAVRNGTSSWWMITIRADLFRSHGNRGSTYLFLRWCVDRYGVDLLSALVHSRLRGAANLEAATGSTFADLYRRWSMALFLSGLEPSAGRCGVP